MRKEREGDVCAFFAAAQKQFKDIVVSRFILGSEELQKGSVARGDFAACLNESITYGDVCLEQDYLGLII